jgi:hypothetical protein
MDIYQAPLSLNRGPLMACSDGLNEGKQVLPVDESRAITRGLMVLSERALAPLLEKEPDLYTVDDLKVRFR